MVKEKAALNVFSSAAFSLSTISFLNTGVNDGCVSFG